MSIRVLDLFCGGGGSSWGARNAGAEIVCGVDVDPLAISAYRRNFAKARALSLRLSNRTRLSRLGELGKIDLLLASPECTNHTHARGSRPSSEASRATARFVITIARQLGPRWLVVENVSEMRNWTGYARFIDALADLGYNPTPVILDAMDFGVPQQRRRLFILCDRERVPAMIIRDADNPRATADSILDPDGTWPSNPLHRPGRAAATLERAERAMSKLGRGVPFLVVYYGSDGGGGWQALDRPLRTITTIDRFALVTWQNDEPYLRMLQVPELMRAMGFGDGYHLDGVGTRRDRVRLLGNGVVPPVMEAIVRRLTGLSGVAGKSDVAGLRAA